MSATNYVQEVRFGAVFFGGGSLAIYENGVAQELLRLVRSTCDEAQPPPRKSTEEVYRKVADYLARRSQTAVLNGSTRFVVDILSGTSAGGINSVFLGKALSCGQNLDTIHDLWLDTADMQTLLNDASSWKGLPSALQKRQSPERSLLNSERMYYLLHQALRDMDEGGTSAPLISECDVWITATDLAGMNVPVRLSFQQANEHIFKHAFHFKFKNASDVNQFTSTYNPILAFAARCTSSFPLAFEPVALADINPILGSAQSTNDLWRPFFQSYTDNKCSFENRYFADGGYLHNKPISFVVDDLLTRRADVPVSRKLIYIDPFPEAASQSGDSQRPSALTNLLDAGTALPRYQTVREEIARVMEHNRLVDRIDRIVEQSKSSSSPAPFYWNLRVSAVTDEIGQMVSRALGLEDDAIGTRAVRAIVRAWRTLNYPQAIESASGAAEFLADFDLSYCIRRLDYMLRHLNRVDTRRALALTPHNDFIAPYRAAADLLCNRKEQLYRRSDDNPVSSWLRSANTRPTALELGNGAHSNLLQATLTIGNDDLLYIVGLDRKTKVGEPLTERKAQERATELLKADTNRSEVLDTVADRLAAFIADAVKESKKQYAEHRSNARSTVEQQLNRLHDEFDNHDAVVFPIAFGVPMGEGAQVDVIRISPADRIVFDSEREGHKLMGQSLGSFGGFLDRRWREYDLLWGRIDAAEQIITALLNGSDPEEVAAREQFIVQACCAILKDENRLPNTEDLFYTDQVKGRCQQALREFDSEIPTQELDREKKMVLLGRATRIAGGVIVDTAHSAGRGLFFANGLKNIATVLGVAAIGGAFALRLVAQRRSSRQPAAAKVPVEQTQEQDRVMTATAG